MKAFLLPLILAGLVFSSLTSAASAQSSKSKKLLVVTITEGFRHGPAIDAAEKVLPELAAKSGGQLEFDFLREPGPRPYAGPQPKRGDKMTDEQWAEKQASYESANAKAKAEMPIWTASKRRVGVGEKGDCQSESEPSMGSEDRCRS